MKGESKYQNLGGLGQIGVIQGHWKWK